MPAFSAVMTRSIAAGTSTVQGVVSKSASGIASASGNPTTVCLSFSLRFA